MVTDVSAELICEVVNKSNSPGLQIQAFKSDSADKAPAVLLVLYKGNGRCRALVKPIWAAFSQSYNKMFSMDHWMGSDFWEVWRTNCVYLQKRILLPPVLCSCDLFQFTVLKQKKQNEHRRLSNMRNLRGSLQGVRDSSRNYTCEVTTESDFFFPHSPYIKWDVDTGWNKIHLICVISIKRCLKGLPLTDVLVKKP